MHAHQCCQGEAGGRDTVARDSAVSEKDAWGDHDWHGIKKGFSTCLRVCTSSPPHDIGCLLYQGRGGNRNQFCCSGVLWGACFVVVGLYIVCFLHVSQNKPHGGGYPYELQVQGKDCCGRHSVGQNRQDPGKASTMVQGHCMYIVFFACACDKRAVVTATHYIHTCFFCFGHVLLVRSDVAGDPRR